MQLNNSMDRISVTFRPITKENWLECSQLNLDSSQENFVASNLFSIAQSKFEPERVPLAIYNSQDLMIGFVMYNDKPLKDGTFRISRLMIGKNYQNQGYGKVVVREVLQRMQQIHGCQEVTIEISKENQIVQKECLSFGFCLYGENDKNLLAKLSFHPELSI